MRLAAVVYEPGQAKAVDAMFVSLAKVLKAGGWRVAGAVQHNRECETACASMALEDIVSGTVFDISVPGTRKSDACSLDPAALEDAAGRVLASLTPDVDLVIINRFGKQEVLGNAFRAVIEAAIADDRPVLVALCSTHSQAWSHFTGDLDVRLPPDCAEMRAWCERMQPVHA